MEYSNVKECVLVNGEIFSVGDKVNIILNSVGISEFGNKNKFKNITIDFINRDGVGSEKYSVLDWYYIESISKWK